MSRKKRWLNFEEWKEYGVERGYEGRNPTSLYKSDRGDERSWYGKGSRNSWIKEFAFSRVNRVSGFWDDSRNIEKEVKRVMKENDFERVPTKTELYELGENSLGSAIVNSYPGGYNGIREEIDGKVLHKPKGYWENFDNVKDILFKLEIELGHFPTQSEIDKSEYGGLTSSISRYHGGLHEVTVKLNRETRSKKRGFWKDWSNVDNELETISKKLGHFPSYEELKTDNYPLLRGIEHHHGGYGVVREKKGLPLSQKSKGYWNELENVISEARTFVEENDLERLPAGDVLSEMGASSLTNGIMKNGGFHKIREILGEDQMVKESGVWMDIDYCLEIARNIKKDLDLTSLPSGVKLRELGYSNLPLAVHRYHGGMSEFRKLLGEDILRVDSQLIRDEGYVLDECEKLLLENDLDELPTERRFAELGQGSLIGGIKRYHGGVVAFREKLREHMGQPAEDEKLEEMLEAYAGVENE